MISNSKGIMVALLPSHLPRPFLGVVEVRRSRAAAAAAPISTASTSAALPDLKKWGARLCSKSLNLAFTGALALGFALGGVGIADAKVGVNRPEMLPKEFSPVIDVAGFLSASQERQLCQEIADLEKDTGVKLRILAQNYPETPGAAVKEFWKVDDQTIVFVADPTFGNMLHFNVGASVDLDVPRSFWSRVAGKYGNMFYWKEKGEDASIEAAVVAISSCLRESTGPSNCLEANTLARRVLGFGFSTLQCASPSPFLSLSSPRSIAPLLSSIFLRFTPRGVDMAMVATVPAFHSHVISSIVVQGRSALPVFSAAKTERKGRGRLRVVGEQCEEVAESRAKVRSGEILLCSIAPYPLLLASALPGASAVRSIFEPFVELVKTWNLPEWLVHWGHPGNMAVVLFAMGGYGTYLGFRIRLSKDTEEKAKAKDLHPKLLGGMFFFFALGATGGITALLTSNKPIFESPHAVSGFLGLALLTVQSLLPTLFEESPGMRTVHGLLGSSIMTLFLLHAALGLQLGLSF